MAAVQAAAVRSARLKTVEVAMHSGGKQKKVKKKEGQRTAQSDSGRSMVECLTVCDVCAVDDGEH